MALVVDPINVGADWSWKIACRLSFKTKEWLKSQKPAKEKEADAFASELLIPMELLKKFQGDLKSPDKLAGIFQVSKPAMAIAIANFFGSAR
ncbi:ImmA/IrrE family metallo-endopeptidase [Geobacter argillaceus]|uniref:Uncharacterized protein DUF955 n=1 Tax=Geobacter argillaceus TaxID=345631 RepID=A0A562VMB3_9BACT|nr:ImmA/IrrE family metallo-endopeptidase [Geobacter argillaceus]TWJ18921.1 uncharacterized protein DUF955 [Geobacter argillaceus]